MRLTSLGAFYHLVLQQASDCTLNLLGKLRLQYSNIRASSNNFAIRRSDPSSGTVASSWDVCAPDSDRLVTWVDLAQNSQASYRPGADCLPACLLG